MVIIQPERKEESRNGLSMDLLRQMLLEPILANPNHLEQSQRGELYRGSTSIPQSYEVERK